MTKKKEITDFLRGIDSTKLTIVFFNYSAKKKWYNIFLLATKFYYWLNNRPKIDHVAFISKWRYGEPYIFEANVSKGMIENNLVERLEHFQGNFYYKTLSRFDSEIINKYKKETEGKKYDIKYKPLHMDASKQLHFTEPWTGSRYSIVFFRIKLFKPVKEKYKNLDFWNMDELLGDYDDADSKHKLD